MNARTRNPGSTIAACALVLVAAACGSSSSHGAAKANVKAAVDATTTTATAAPSTTAGKAKVTAPHTVAPTSPPTAAPTVAPATAPPTVAPTSPPVTAAPTTTVGVSAAGRLVSVPGVTPAELKRAQTLLDTTIVALKRFATPQQAYAAGYRSIGDAVTGDEHYTNWSYADDGNILDPAKPESVVYEYVNGKQTAVAAMYALPFGSSFAKVPDVGGALTQWHVHRDLCLTTDPQHRVVSGIVGLHGTCPPGTNKAGNTPMLHVWRIPNPCGPFAALEGIGAGQVPQGQTRNCDTTNASVP